MIRKPRVFVWIENVLGRKFVNYSTEEIPRIHGVSFRRASISNAEIIETELKHLSSIGYRIIRDKKSNSRDYYLFSLLFYFLFTYPHLLHSNPFLLWLTRELLQTGHFFIFIFNLTFFIN